MKYIWIGLLLSLTSSLYACDICGCAGGDNVFGLLPAQRANFFSLRYNYSSFSVEHPALFSFEEASRANNYYHSLNLWGRYGFFKNRLQIFASLPMHHYAEKEESGLQSQVMGLGDAQISLQVVLFNSSDSASYKLRHSLQIGAGIKLPTGQFRSADSQGQPLPANMQLGSGSTDLPLSMLYNVQYRKVGLNLEGQYRWNSRAAATQYQFGQQIQGSLLAFYQHRYRNWLWMPNAGLAVEARKRDRLRGIPQDFTGGYALWAQAGLQCFWKRWSVGLRGQLPIVQDLGDGYIQAHPRMSAQVLFMF